DLVGNLAHRAEDRIDRDEADRRIFRTVLRGGDIALAAFDGEFHRQIGALVEGADHEVRIEDLDVVAGVDLARLYFGRALGLEAHPLRTVAGHAESNGLDVEDDVGDVFAHTGDRREFMQHAVDMDGRNGSALQRGQQHATQGIAQGQREATFQRLGDDDSSALGVATGIDLLVRLNQLGPVLLNHSIFLLLNSEWQFNRYRLLPIT